MKGNYKSALEQSVEAFKSAERKSDIKESPLRSIEIDLLDENPDNEQIFGMQNIESISDDMKKDRYSGAITVFDKGDGRYEISSGHRRYRAAKEAGKTSLDAIVYPYPNSNQEKALWLILSNARNRVYTPLGWAKMIKYYMDTQGESRKKGERMRENAANFFNLSSSRVERYLQLLKLNANLQSLVDKVDFPYTSLVKASNLSDEEQTFVYNKIKDRDDISGKEIEDIIASLMDKKEGKKSEKKDVYIDTYLKNTSKKLSTMIRSGKLQVEDKAIVAGYIDDLKKSIKEIEESLDAT